MKQSQIADMVRHIDLVLPLPEHPSDKCAVEFGTTGVLAMSGDTAVVMASYDDPQDLLDDPFMELAPRLYGHMFVVAYGAVVAEGDNDIHPARIIIGVSKEGLVSTLMRTLDVEGYVHDETGDQLGELHYALIKMAKGE